MQNQVLHSLPYDFSSTSYTFQWLEELGGIFPSIHAVYLPYYKIFTSPQIWQWACSGFCPEVTQTLTEKQMKEIVGF